MYGTKSEKWELENNVALSRNGLLALRNSIQNLRLFIQMPTNINITTLTIILSV